MPVPKKVLNAFPATEVRDITGLSLPMINYLSHEGFLVPSYGTFANPRGKVRYYSYRDLVVARLIQRLRETGVELSRLKQAVAKLSAEFVWQADLDPIARLSWVVSDGKEVLLRNEDGFLDDLSGRGAGQRSFAFVVHLGRLEAEVKALVPMGKRKRFTMENKALEYASTSAKRVRRA